MGKRKEGKRRRESEERKEGGWEPARDEGRRFNLAEGPARDKAGSGQRAVETTAIRRTSNEIDSTGCKRHR